MKHIAIFSLFCFAMTGLVRAQSVSVQAALSHTHAGVGEPVQLTVSVTGARQAEIPDNFALDGLPVVQRSQSTQVNIINFQMTATVNYTFVLLPQREGTFTIPPLAIRVGSDVYPTEPLTLEVSGSGSLNPPGAVPQQAQPSQPFRPAPGMTAPPAPAPTPGQQGVPIDQIARMELIVPQTEVFVGQVVPVELRLYLDNRFQFELGQMPNFSGEGFVAERLSEPEQRSQVIDGVPYEVITFTSSLTPVKSGALQIPPAEFVCNVIVPGTSRRTGSLFDDFFGGDPFGGMFGERRELQVRSNAVNLQALPVPKDGRPADFAGAIGQFSLSQRMDPARGEVGEPMKLKVEISGAGNFKGIPQPALEETDGWRIYSGGDKFAPADAIGFGGSKTFDITVMPTKEVTQSPVAQFSYFDPVERKFVTLRGEPQPVLVRGGTAPAPTPQVAATAVAAASPTPTPDATASPADPALAAAPDPGKQWVPFVDFVPASFTTLPARREFLFANGAALVAILALVSAFLIRRHAASPAARRRKLQKSCDALLAQLQSPSLEMRDFFDKAERFIRVQGQVFYGESDSLPDAANIVSNPLLTAEVREGLSKILAINNELRFSSRPQTPNSLQRDRSLEALQAMHRALKS